MYLSQLTTPPVLPVTVSELAVHLRIGSGFEDDGAEDALLLTYVQSATAAIERALSLALAERSYELSLSRWDADGGATLPVGPVVAVDSVGIVSDDGEDLVDATRWYMAKGRPVRLLPRGIDLPLLDAGHTARIVFRAGFGTEAEDIPADLRQAVSLLASHFYEDRSGTAGSASGFPREIEALIAPYRPVRL